MGESPGDTAKDNREAKGGNGEPKSEAQRVGRQGAQLKKKCRSHAESSEKPKRAEGR